MAWISEDVKLIDEDQPQRIINEFQLRENLIRTARGTIEPQLRAITGKIPDNNTLLKNRPLEDCAKLLEYVILKVSKVPIIYMRSNTKQDNEVVYLRQFPQS